MFLVDPELHKITILARNVVNMIDVYRLLNTRRATQKGHPRRATQKGYPKGLLKRATQKGYSKGLPRSMRQGDYQNTLELRKLTLKAKLGIGFLVIIKKYIA